MMFVRNPQYGKVKTRLAKTVGNERALEVYLTLLAYTVSVTVHGEYDKAVFFSDELEHDEMWTKEGFARDIQKGNDLGERMTNAFSKAFSLGYKRVIIIGSDCPELSLDIINKGFQSLEEYDTVIGPARDGGYYLLGMRKFYPFIFSNQQWSTENVFLDTILHLQRNKLTYSLLDTLSDVDEEKDLKLLDKIMLL